MRDEGFGSNAIEKSIRRRLYAAGDFSYAAQRLAHMTDNRPDTLNLDDLRFELEHHWDHQVTRLRALLSSGRFIEAESLREFLLSNSNGFKEAQAALRREFGRSLLQEDSQIENANTRIDDVLLRLQVRGPRPEDITVLRDTLHQFGADHPIADRVRLLAEIIYPGQDL
jgi:hypothetical protein